MPESTEEADWTASGCRELTGRHDGVGLPAPGAPASSARAGLAVLGSYTAARVPGVQVLGERAALAGLRRNAPFSPGGTFRALRARDGWLGISLARPSDIELLPALMQTEQAREPWRALASWIEEQAVTAAAARAHLLGLPAAIIPERIPPEQRPPVLVTPGGPRGRQSQQLTVVDLTSLWAGPLCARLLGRAGLRIVKVESRQRPDGARQGTAEFFHRLHDGHEFLQLDFATERSTLANLVAEADVLLEASRPRALAHLGIDPAEHVARGTIWASITAYGRSGDAAMRVGFGDDVAAGAGLVAWLDGHPVPVGDAIADPLAGVHAAAAVAIALAGDIGCLLDVSMHAVAARAAAPTR